MSNSIQGNTKLSFINFVQKTVVLVYRKGEGRLWFASCGLLLYITIHKVSGPPCLPMKPLQAIKCTFSVIPWLRIRSELAYTRMIPHQLQCYKVNTIVWIMDLP